MSEKKEAGLSSSGLSFMISSSLLLSKDLSDDDDDDDDDVRPRRSLVTSDNGRSMTYVMTRIT